MSSRPRHLEDTTDIAADLCDPAHGRHIFQAYIRQAHEALARHWGCQRLLVRPGQRGAGGLGAPPPTTVAESLPGMLADLAIDPPEDALIIAPARTTGPDGTAAHRLALLRLSTNPLGTPALGAMLQRLLAELLPSQRYRLLPERFHLTRESMAVEVHHRGGWVSLGHCGQLTARTLADAGIPTQRYCGLLVEVGLERLDAVRRGPNAAVGIPGSSHGLTADPSDSEIVAEENVEALVHR